MANQIANRVGQFDGSVSVRQSNQGKVPDLDTIRMYRAENKGGLGVEPY